jgi:hypothetical protein
MRLQIAVMSIPVAALALVCPWPAIAAAVTTSAAPSQMPGGSAAGPSTMDREIDQIIDQITKPPKSPAPKKATPGTVPETALPGPGVPLRGTSHALAPRPLSASEGLVQRLFGKPLWRAEADAAEAALPAHFDLPRGH